MNRRLVLWVAPFFPLVVLFACASFDDGKTSHKIDDSVGAYEESKAFSGEEDVNRRFNIGLNYYNRQNYSEALRWYRKAADQGHALAQFNLGVMYATGQGVPQDYGKAVKWFRKAAEQGDAKAQFNLAIMYAKGEGVPKDDAEAAKWVRKAAGQGCAQAQAFLGTMYGLGQGVPKNSVEAWQWLNLASAGGEENAVKSRSALEREMTPGQIAEAQRLSASWQPKSPSHADAPRPFPDQTEQSSPASREIPLVKQGGVYEVPVKINGVISLNFILDTGASEVNIPADVALTLWRTGTITKSDFLPGASYHLADGSILDSSRFIIHELDIGGITITKVPASIGPATASLLLGQSFLGRLES